MSPHVYVSGAMLTPAHGTNGHSGALLALDPTVWRCNRCYTVAVGNDAWRALVTGGWCTGALAALPAALSDVDGLDDEDLVEVEHWDDVTAVAHAVSRVFDIGAAASTDPIARSAQCGGMSYGWRYDACTARGPLTVQSDGWSRSWPRKRVAAAVAAACTDPDIAAGLDRWRALSLELSRLADRHSWKDPARAAEIERERHELRRDIEDRYGTAAALDLLDVAPAVPAAPAAGQLSLFGAAS